MAEPLGPFPSSLDHLAAIVESSDDAILSKDPNGIITSWNPAAERIYGYTAEEAIGQPIAILIPREQLGEDRRILDRVLAGERVDHYETERVRKDGRRIVVSLSLSPIRDESGAVVSAAVIARDITASHRSRDLAERLHSLTSALASELDADRTVELLLAQTAGALAADAGTLALLDRSRETLELRGSTGHSPERLNRFSSFPLDADLPMSVAVRTGNPISTTSMEELRGLFPILADAPMSFESLVVIPLSVEDTPLGALSLSFANARRLGPEESAFLHAVAQQAAQTLERIRLHKAEEAARERLSFLADASELLAHSLDPEVTLRRLADLAVPRVADWCGVDLLAEDGTIENVAVSHVDPDRIRLAEELRSRYPVDPDADTGAPQVIRTGQSEHYPEIPDELLVEAAEDEEHLRLIRELGLASAIVAPLKAKGRTLGAVSFVAAESGRRYDESDLELAEDLARRAALAIDNALSYRREHDAAVTLQRSLLPDSLPELEGFEFATHYEPAGPGVEVGGDWYEVVACEDGSVGLMIGDVAGRGIRAAAVMGRLRPALRALLAEGHGPAEALKRVDGMLRESGSKDMATVFLARLEPAAGTGRYVRAGHLPALLRSPDGVVTRLSGSGTPPLGVLEPLDPSEHSFETPPGSLLLLYTDGLIERRGVPLEAGLSQLAEAFAAAPGTPQECLKHLAGEFGADAVEDDVAMLATAVTG